MTEFFDFNEIFRDFNEIMKRFQGFESLEQEVKSGKLKGGWDVKEIDEPHIKGYVIQGRFYSDQPIKPFDPFTPKNPFERRPIPQRSFKPSALTPSETREPLTDVFQEATAVKIYVELPGEEKDDIQLNVTKGQVEIKAKQFYKMIQVPQNVEIEKATSKYNNGVLIITIPKDETIPENEKRRITID
jgi:HSP20 family molecular chaperone IbpA